MVGNTIWDFSRSEVEKVVAEAVAKAVTDQELHVSKYICEGIVLLGRVFLEAPATESEDAATETAVAVKSAALKTVIVPENWLQMEKQEKKPSFWDFLKPKPKPDTGVKK